MSFRAGFLVSRLGGVVLWAGLSVLSGCKDGKKGADSSCLQFELLGGSAHQPSNVVIFFKVETCDGRPLQDLGAEELILSEDGQLISPSDSERTLLPGTMAYDRFVAVLLDVSGSATEPGTVSGLQEAAHWFVDQVAGTHRVGIYLFDGRADLVTLSPFTRDGAALHDAVDTLSAYVPVDPSTNLNGAVVSGLVLLDSESSVSEAPEALGTLLIFTDGVDRAGRLSDAEAEGAVQATGHAVFAVALGDGADMTHMAAIGRSGLEQAIVPEGLIGAFDRVGESMLAESAKYRVLAYCTMKRAGQHQVAVEVSGKTGQLFFDFWADGFQGGCSTTAIADSCVGRQCGVVEGGLLCGSCEAGQTCNLAGQCL